jgi:hypothetical protein
MRKEVEEGAFEKSCKGNGKDKVNVALHIHVSKQGKRVRFERFFFKAHKIMS